MRMGSGEGVPPLQFLILLVSPNSRGGSYKAVLIKETAVIFWPGKFYRNIC